MAKRNLKNKLISKKEIKEEMKIIEGSNSDYITPTGQVYSDYGNNMFLHKKLMLIKIMDILIVEFISQKVTGKNEFMF